MGMMRFAGLLAVVPVAVLLTISYLVLVVNKKQEAGALKAFGYAVVVLLLVAAGIIFAGGSYKLLTGKHCCMMQGMMKQGQMMKGQISEQPMKRQMPLRAK